MEGGHQSSFSPSPLFLKGMFGELICGPPGSGKTTYCEGKRQFLSVYDPCRPVIMVNFDPANESVFPYPCDVDIRDVVCLEKVMEEENLGPNGSYLFCAEVIGQRVDWVVGQIESAVERRIEEVYATAGPSPTVKAPYLLIDCPGQVEFYINSDALHVFISKVQKRVQCSLCTVHLVDAAIATRDIPSYVSSCVLALTTMIDHELPHINLLTKWDTVENTEGVESEFEIFLSGSNFSDEDFERVWVKQIKKKRYEQYVAAQCLPSDKAAAYLKKPEDLPVDLEKECGTLYKHTKALMGVVEGYGIVGFLPLAIQSENMMLKVTREIDGALGNFV
ncbi:cytoplasmic protein [Angomonas deanei]|uniref:GPN-loop GTPase 2 n=1 Tax=Angomonas deanei TaxID=59799 RepID=S9U9H1_9TRYP|nr:cytoplasmic protein [Angomonas deanei]EPY32990.1 cytoplasmic protein [Angomonas deanei]CAD2215880.1 Conserved hypothetical ATP binding protein, putative [Angomonas deanei]|eukprot:EPY25429.1 cytoplasmic protein [Angomonas deanei]